ncbi:MAG: sugar transferase [Candidatus Aegiribacteria sp.]|nr:sugar transferase [Candidatus Aegiribacteria sp.]
MNKRNLLWLLPITDLALIAGIFMGGFWLRHSLLADLMGSDFRLSVYHYFLTGTVLGSVQVAFMAVFGVYRREFGLGMIEEVAGIIRGALMAVLFTLAMTFITRQLLFSRFVLVFSFPASALLLSFWHSQFRKLSNRTGSPSRILILGISDQARQLGGFMENRAQIKYIVVDYVDPDTPSKEISEIIRKKNIHELVVADHSIPPEKLSSVILTCEKLGIQYKIAADVFAIVSLTARVAHMGGTILIESVPAPLTGWGLVLKRTTDLLLASTFIVLLSPIFILTALVIVIDSGLPVFYRQTRLGRDNNPFKMLKFRSMRVGAHSEKSALSTMNESKGPLFKIRNDPRVTCTGKFIRRWSIDELPQLFNVLSGKMSLVGPRPPLPEEVEEYSRKDFKRLRTIPGVTGVWQISGRSNLGFDEMVKLDLYYVDNWSIWMDLAILMLTPSGVIEGSGAY